MQEKNVMDRNLFQNRRQVEENYFPMDRGLRRKSRAGGTSYLTYFRTPFFDQLKTLRKDDWWLDIGGGELYAQVDYLTLDDFARCEHSKVAVVSVSDPGTEYFERNRSLLVEKLGDRFFYRSGKLIEEMPEWDIPKAALVSDMFAAMSFSERIDLTLQRELDALEVGGVLFTKIQKAYIRDKDDKRHGLMSYFGSVKGADMKFFGFNTLVMEKTDELVEVPELELVRFLSYKNVDNPKKLDDRFLFCERYYSLK